MAVVFLLRKNHRSSDMLFRRRHTPSVPACHSLSLASCLRTCVLLYQVLAVSPLGPCVLSLLLFSHQHQYQQSPPDSRDHGHLRSHLTGISTRDLSCFLHLPEKWEPLLFTRPTLTPLSASTIPHGSLLDTGVTLMIILFLSFIHCIFFKQAVSVHSLFLPTTSLSPPQNPL